jgi:dTDP-glucose 4,6-dehydratase
MRILVTGGAGFIGSNFIHYTLKKYPNYEIVNLDALTYCGNLENLTNIENNPNYQFIKGNIANEKLVDEIVSNDIEYIINFAAESHVDRSIEDPKIFLESNIIGTQNLLEIAKKYYEKGQVEKYVQISTDEVYGSLGKTGYFTENTPLAPNSPYSASKAGADLLVRAYNETFNLPINITRCSNNYGPYQFPEKLIPLMINNAINNKELPVYGDGKNVRDWLHVHDHCTAIDLVLHNGKIGEVYNIGGNNEKENIEIVKLILGYLNKPENLIKYVKDRLGHDRRYAIDSTKIQEKLGWKPDYTFEIGIKKTIKWYLANSGWLNSVISGDYISYYEKMYNLG